MWQSGGVVLCEVNASNGYRTPREAERPTPCQSRTHDEYAVTICIQLCMNDTGDHSNGLRHSRCEFSLV